MILVLTIHGWELRSGTCTSQSTRASSVRTCLAGRQCAGKRHQQVDQGGREPPSPSPEPCCNEQCGQSTVGPPPEQRGQKTFAEFGTSRNGKNTRLKCVYCTFYHWQIFPLSHSTFLANCHWTCTDNYLVIGEMDFFHLELLWSKFVDDVVRLESKLFMSNFICCSARKTRNQKRHVPNRHVAPSPTSSYYAIIIASLSRGPTRLFSFQHVNNVR